MSWANDTIRASLFGMIISFYHTHFYYPISTFRNKRIKSSACWPTSLLYQQDYQIQQPTISIPPQANQHTISLLERSTIRFILIARHRINKLQNTELCPNHPTSSPVRHTVISTSLLPRKPWRMKPWRMKKRSIERLDTGHSVSIVAGKTDVPGVVTACHKISGLNWSSGLTLARYGGWEIPGNLLILLPFYFLIKMFHFPF